MIPGVLHRYGTPDHDIIVDQDYVAMQSPLISVPIKGMAIYVTIYRKYVGEPLRSKEALPHELIPKAQVHSPFNASLYEHPILLNSLACLPTRKS